VDFIERVLHVDPDGGSGVLEATYLAVGVLFVVAVACRKAVAAAVRRCATLLRRGD
jgi:hypothetical protein